MKELTPDTAVEADASRDILHVGPHALAQIGHLVDEGDFHRQEGVRRILRQLGGFQTGEEDRRLDQVEGSIQPPKHFPRPFAFRADHDPVRPHEVPDRTPLAEEFRVARHVEIQLRARMTHDLRDPTSGPDWNRRFGHDDRIPGQRPRDLLGCSVDVADIGMPVPAPGWGTDRDEHRFDASHSRGQIVAEAQPPRRDVVGDQPIQARLVDGNTPIPQRFELGCVRLDDRDLDSEICEAGAGNQSDIPTTDHCDSHSEIPFCATVIQHIWPERARLLLIRCVNIEPFRRKWPIFQITGVHEIDGPLRCIFTFLLQRFDRFQCRSARGQLGPAPHRLRLPVQ